ncbi:hydrophobic surface binding protein A-domain-containing protein [Xylaria castorea]|nr:hydrophobic surface binding protein A-domain-containing protein [Xylaria castorea]
MKVTAFLPVVAFAFTAAAEMHLYSFPTPVKRDINTVTSAVAQISDAITQLDSSVKAFSGGDSAQLKSAAENLVSTIKSGASAIASGGSIELSDALGLQDAATSLAAAGQALIGDLESKKAAFEASQLCDTIQSTIKSIGSEVTNFVDSVVKQLPADAQETAKQLTSGIAEKLNGGAASFGISQCNNNNQAGAVSATSSPVVHLYPTTSAAAIATLSSSSSAAAAVGQEEGGAVTVTVTAPCVCESSSVPVMSSESISIPLLTPGTTSVPYPTGSNSTTSVLPTGAVATTSATAIPTAGAGANGVGVVGLMAGLVAALFV